MLSPDLQRISRIRDYCGEIEHTVARCEGNFSRFCEDADLQRSISFSILQIGELVGGLSESYRSATEAHIAWGTIKGMRNIIVHNYGNVELNIVWDSAVGSVPALKAFCETQLQSEN